MAGPDFEAQSCLDAGSPLSGGCRPRTRDRPRERAVWHGPTPRARRHRGPSHRRHGNHRSRRPNLETGRRSARLGIRGAESGGCVLHAVGLGGRRDTVRGTPTPRLVEVGASTTKLRGPDRSRARFAHRRPMASRVRPSYAASDPEPRGSPQRRPMRGDEHPATSDA